MKNLLLLLLTALFSCQNQMAKRVEKADQLIAEIKNQYVKDGRTAHFLVSASQNKKQLVIKGETTMPAAKTALFQSFAGAKMACVDSLQVLPAPDLQGKIFGIVNLSVCNIRSQPKHSAELATQALLGTPLRVWKREGSFYFIQTPDDYFGWVDSGGLTLMDTSAFEKWQASSRAACLHDGVFLLEKPDPNAAKISDLAAGNILQLIESHGSYAKLAFPDCRTGYLQNNHLLPYPEWLASRQASAENILTAAREMLGRPYLWGGTSGKGLDCSGFTKMVFFLNGIQLERDASLQVHTGVLVETDTSAWANLQPGDLLFFGRKTTPEKGERVSHVAIYMGDGKIIHASDRVKTESLRRSDPDFVEDRVRTFIRAKRMIGSEGKNGVVALRDSPWYRVRP